MNRTSDSGRPAGIEEVLLQYLDGTLSKRGVEGLNVRLGKSPGLQREFAEMLLNEVQLNEIGREIREGIEESPVVHMRPFYTVLWRITAGTAAAAVITVVLGLLCMTGRYPSPRAAGDFIVSGGDTVERGTVVETRSGEAELSLGGYCRIAIKPDSAVRIEGEEYAEKVFLKRGQVLCDVDRDAGTFDVGTDAGTVSVTGTRFIVKYFNEKESNKSLHVNSEKGEKDMNAKRIFVKVLAGAVLVSGAWGSMPLTAGEEGVMPRETRETEKPSLPKSLYGFSGMVQGAVVSKGDGHTFTFKMKKLLRVWRDNKASNPAAIVGRTVHVGSRWVKNKRGKWHRVEAHVAFIRTLKPGQAMTLEIKHAERHMFAILELSEEQRQLVEKAKAEFRKGDREGGRHDEEGRDIRHDEGKHEGDRHKQEIEAEIRELRKRLHELEARLEKLKKHGGERERELKRRDEEEKPRADRNKGETEGVIKVGKAHYKSREHEAWTNRGRIVGHLSKAPKCVIKVLNAYGNIVKTVEIRRGSKVYEIEWLNPGMYTMRVQAEGYRTFKVKVRVKSGKDLFLDLNFSGSKKQEGTVHKEVELF